MNMSAERQRNQVAYRQLVVTIDASYTPGQFVAIAGGKIIADARSFHELDAALQSAGQNSAEVLVVQAGVHYPESAALLWMSC